MGSLNEYPLVAIRNFVHEELCNRNELMRGAFPITERIVTKRGQPCGLFFCLHGPRSVRLTAVYDFQESRVWFYDSKGKRSGSDPISVGVSDNAQNNAQSLQA